MILYSRTLAVIPYLIDYGQKVSLEIGSLKYVVVLVWQYQKNLDEYSLIR